MEGQRLPGAVNPKHFPAKLWQLVNSPGCGSVRWDARGEGLVIDQRLFERELLGEGAALGAHFFKTSNFASFIRQLNLYGFRKLGRGRLQDPAGGDGSSSAEPLLHFQSPHFRRDRPELLVRLKRLTSAKKAKLAAGLELPSRPPSTLGEAARPGLVTVGPVAQPCRPDSFFPACSRADSCQDPPAFQAATSEQLPVPSRPWQGSVGLLPGPGAFPGQGAPFPVLHKCCTEVTYTLRTVFSLLPLQRGAPAGASLPAPGSCASPGQCLRAPDPTRTPQCSPPAQGGPLAVSASAVAAASTDCGFVQSPEAQAPSAAECRAGIHGAHHASEDEEKLVELSSVDVFQFFNEMYASRGADVVTLEESWDGELFGSYISAAIESAGAAEPVQEVSPEGAQREPPKEPREQLDHNPAELSRMIVLEALFSAEQENASVKYQSVREERELTSGAEPAHKAAEEPGSPAEPPCRKRRHSSQQDPQEPEGGACKRGCFWRKTPE